MKQHDQDMDKIRILVELNSLDYEDLLKIEAWANELKQRTRLTRDMYKINPEMGSFCNGGARQIKAAI